MAGPETRIGGANESFPETVWTLVLEAADAREPLGRLLSLYWRPIYAWIRRRWEKSIEDTKDLTQGFMEAVLDSHLLDRARRDRGSFRGYLKTALENYLIGEHRRDQAQKRGGGNARFALDAAELSQVLPVRETDEPGDAFDREWVSTALERGVAELQSQLRARGKSRQFEVFRVYYLDAAGGEPRTYAEVARAMGLKVDDVGNYLREARDALRAILRDQVRHCVSSVEYEEYELDFLLRP